MKYWFLRHSAGQASQSGTSSKVIPPPLSPAPCHPSLTTAVKNTIIAIIMVTIINHRHHDHQHVARVKAALPACWWGFQHGNLHNLAANLVAVKRESISAACNLPLLLSVESHKKCLFVCFAMELYPLIIKRMRSFPFYCPEVKAFRRIICPHGMNHVYFIWNCHLTILQFVSLLYQYSVTEPTKK